MHHSGTRMVARCTCGVATPGTRTSSGHTPVLQDRLRPPMANVWMHHSGTRMVARCTCGVATPATRTSSGHTPVLQQQRNVNPTNLKGVVSLGVAQTHQTHKSKQTE